MFRNDMDIIMMSEIKIQEGERMTDFTLYGYTEEVFLREDHPEGGIMIWAKNGLGLITQVWEEKTNSERVWIKVESKYDKFAIGHVYLRTNKGKDH